MAVNIWRGKNSRDNFVVDQDCPVCRNGSRETLLHRFWECPSAVRAWKWGAHVLEKLVPYRGNEQVEDEEDWGDLIPTPLPLPPPDSEEIGREDARQQLTGNAARDEAANERASQGAHSAHSAQSARGAPGAATALHTQDASAANRNGGTQLPDLNSEPESTHTQQRRDHSPNLNWKHGIFAYRMSWRYKKVSRIWLLMRGSIMWALWKERNDAAFSNTFWDIEKLCSKIWVDLVDYGRIAWERTKANPKKQSISPGSLTQRITHF